MTVVRTFCGLLPMALALSLGCGKKSPESSAASTSSTPGLQSSRTSSAANAAASSDRRLDRIRRDAPVAGPLLVAARDLALSEAQKAKTAEIERQLRGEESAPRGEFQQYQSTLIAGVKDGKVDLAKLAEIKASMLKVVQERKDKEGEALDALYATLEPAQRKTLANTVRARQAERDARQPPRPPHEAHNGEDADAIKRRLDSLTKDLSLDDAQRKSTEALLAKDARPVGDDLEAAKEEMTRRMNATLVAFEGEGFSAKKLDLTSGSPGKMLDAMEQHAKFVSLLLPILKPDQRAKLAANMEKPFGPRVGPR